MWWGSDISFLSCPVKRGLLKNCCVSANEDRLARTNFFRGFHTELVKGSQNSKELSAVTQRDNNASYRARIRKNGFFGIGFLKLLKTYCQQHSEEQPRL